MKTCLVTGGAGFIGSHLIETLLPEFKTICIDNLGSGNKENIKLFFKNRNFRFIDYDVTKPLKVKEKIDFVFHLASRASPIDYQKHPIETLMANSFGTYNMLNLAKEKKARFFFASSSEVYGEPKEHPQPETYWGNVNPTGLRSCYDESKRFGEALCMAFWRKFGLDIRIGRFFNTYGPRMRVDDGRVIPNFISQALKDKPLTVYGDGKQSRSFCYVSDLVGGIKKVMFENNLAGEVFNLGNQNEITILELAKKIKALTYSSSKIVFKNLPQDDPTKRRPNLLKARKRLGWEPKVKLDGGLRKTINWFKKIL